MGKKYRFMKNKTAASKGLTRAQQRRAAERERKQREGRSKIKEMCASARLSDGVAEYAQDLWMLTQKKRIGLWT